MLKGADVGCAPDTSPNEWKTPTSADVDIAIIDGCWTLPPRDE
jgi:hypothetical protein